MKILLIDDVRVWQNCVIEALNLFLDKPEIITANTVDSAIALLTDDITLVITDYDFPGGGFPSLLSHLGNKKYLVVSAKDRDVPNFINKDILIRELPRWLKNAGYKLRF